MDRIDHITLFVPNPPEAVEWYERVLGFERGHEFDRWAEEGGPLMLGSDGTETQFALFEGSPVESDEHAPSQHVAFRASRSGFWDVVEKLERLSTEGVRGLATRDDIVDHDLSYSIYFHDPSGNVFEVTTYDYEAVTRDLETDSPPA